MNVREKLPIILIVLCIFWAITDIYSIFRNLTIGEDVFIWTNSSTIIEFLGVGIVVFKFRKKEEWVMETFSYIVLLYFFLVHFNFLLRVHFITPSVPLLFSNNTIGNISLIVLLAILIIAFEKGTMKELFIKKGYIVDKIFYIFVVAKLSMLTVFNVLDTLYYYMNDKFLGLMHPGGTLWIIAVYRGLSENSVFLILIIAGLLVNILPKPDDFITRIFNPCYMIYVLFIAFSLELLHIFTLVRDYRIRGYSFEFSQFLRYINLGGVTSLIILYIILKFITIKATKLYFDEVKTSKDTKPF